MLQLFFLLLPLVCVKSLTEEENDHLQHTCGRPYHKNTGTTPIPRQKRSLYGIPANPDDAPWAVSIAVASNWSPNMTQTQFNEQLHNWCTGSLISNRHVITAARCIGWENTDCEEENPFGFNPIFELKDIQRLQVIIGSNCATEKFCGDAGKPFSAKYVRKVRRVFMPSYYKCGNSNFVAVDVADVAVFELEEEIPFNSNLYSACLSASGENGFLKKHVMKVVECEQDSYDEGFQFCVQNPITLGCWGDIGAGIVSRDDNGSAFVNGVLSGGPACYDFMQLQQTGNVEGLKDVYARVTPHLSWICLATGICATEKAKNDVIAFKSVRNHSPWFATIEKLE